MSLVLHPQMCRCGTRRRCSAPLTAIGGRSFASPALAGACTSSVQPFIKRLEEVDAVALVVGEDHVVVAVLVDVDEAQAASRPLGVDQRGARRAASNGSFDQRRRFASTGEDDLWSSSTTISSQLPSPSMSRSRTRDACWSSGNPVEQCRCIHSTHLPAVEAPAAPRRRAVTRAVADHRPERSAKRTSGHRHGESASPVHARSVGTPDARYSQSARCRSPRP